MSTLGQHLRRSAVLVLLMIAAMVSATAVASAKPVPTSCEQPGVMRIAVPGALQFCYEGTPGHLDLGYDANYFSAGAYYGVVYYGDDCTARAFRPNNGFGLQGYVCGLDITPPF